MSPPRSNERPPGELRGVFASEPSAQVAIATHWAGPDDYVTVVRRGAFTWAVYVDRNEIREIQA